MSNMLSVGLVYAPRVWSGSSTGSSSTVSSSTGSSSTVSSSTVKTIIGYKLVDGFGWIEYSTLWSRILTADEISLEKKRLGI